ncbi:MAG: UDP-glucose 4-epimerase, partial [Deltaproteobacteria bacterium]|nr:UDP-glucose 4-epimerase [Deltaproteobacteria bacterium]
MNILVIGGAGYIGSHMVKLLLENGDSVVILDNFSTGHRDAILGGEVIEGDLVEAMHEHGAGNLIFSSSAAVFGEPEYVPIDERHPKNPVNPYGTSKLMVERMLADFDHAYGLRSISLRYFNAAGADPDGLLGERHDPESHLIPLVLQAASGRRRA